MHGFDHPRIVSQRPGNAEYVESNLVPRVFLRHTLITNPNEHPGTLRSNLPRKWVNMEAIMDFTVG